MDFIRTIVLAVVEVVAAKDRADAMATGALELIFLTYWCGRSQFWRSIGVTGKQIILIIKLHYQKIHYQKMQNTSQSHDLHHILLHVQ